MPQSEFPINPILRPLHEGDDHKSFKLKGPKYRDLRRFLSRYSKDYHQNNLAKTFVVTENDHPGNIWAFITLVASEIKNDENTHPGDGKDFKYGSFPAIKLARLAVHDDLRGQGIGSQIVAWCLSHIDSNIMPHAGCRFLVLDAKQESVNFYLNQGFTMLDTEENKASEHPLMFMDLHKLVTE